MKYLVYYFFIVILIMRCNVSENKPLKSKPAEAQVSKQYIIKKIFDEDEKTSMDSVRKYQLDSVYHSCLRYLYVIYGIEVLSDSANNGITIGECNIRIVGFKNKLGNVKEMTYGVFVNDSTPTNVIIKTSMGHMINGFEVDVKKKTILVGRIGELGKIDISNVQELYNNAVRSKIFTDYIIKYKERLHPKFAKLLESIKLY